MNEQTDDQLKFLSFILDKRALANGHLLHENTKIRKHIVRSREKTIFTLTNKTYLYTTIRREFPW